MGESPNGSSVSLDVATPVDDEVNETVKTLTDKLTAALVNVAAKESLVEQHARVAEEAVAGTLSLSLSLPVVYPTFLPWL